MISHEIDNGDRRFAFDRAQTTPQLLQKYDAGLSRSQHHDSVYSWNVDAFVENVNSTDSIKLSPREPREGRLAIVRSFGSEDCCCANASRAQPSPDKHGMSDAAAEHQRTSARVLFQGMPQRLH